MACRVIWWENLLKISESRRRIECWCVISIKNVEYLTWLLLVDVMEELAIALLVRCYCRHRTNSLFILMLMCFNSSYLNCSTIYLMFSWASYNSNDKRVFFFLLSYNCSHRIPYIGRLLLQTSNNFRMKDFNSRKCMCGSDELGWMLHENEKNLYCTIEFALFFLSLFVRLFLYFIWCWLFVLRWRSN